MILYRSLLHTRRGCLQCASRFLHVQSAPLQGSFNRQPNNSWTYRIINRLSQKEKMLLYQELSKTVSGKLDCSISKSETEESPVTYNQLKLVVAGSCLPFIGFGFLDNAIMIIAGEYIDLTFSAMLGISTMAAAGLGNLVSDLFGIG
uniref:Transmembrane protein 65 n=1 Tax=Trichobilharzia regenti TaxID=157069 RepID=A0AA85JH81_TRIRE|nr:unnamed protein product [Trichobilharzia regenti]